jgi:hypothetical protein
MASITVGVAVVLDADVLHRANVRDLLLRVAQRGLFQPLWTIDILGELDRSLISRGYTRDQTARLTTAMNDAFPSALVAGYRRHVNRLELPDAADRHVAAAAIKAKCRLIATFNLSDFPAQALKTHDIEAIHPDALLTALIGLDQATVLASVDTLLSQLKNPPITFDRLMTGLRAQALNGFCTAIEGARRTRG